MSEANNITLFSPQRYGIVNIVRLMTECRTGFCLFSNVQFLGNNTNRLLGCFSLFSHLLKGKNVMICQIVYTGIKKL